MSTFRRKLQTVFWSDSPAVGNAAIAIRRVLGRRALVATIASCAIIASVAAASSQASYGNVYVSFPTWLGNCPGGGNVVGIYAANSYIWSTPATGDWGDDLIYPGVVMFAGAPYNQISAQNICSRPWYRGGNYRSTPVSASIYPTRNGQTFWVGPFGQSHN
jgi:hypothetical protein